MTEPDRRRLAGVFPTRKAMRRCIVDGCDWSNVDDVTVDSPIGTRLADMRDTITLVVETQLRAHLATEHDVVDFARTINRLTSDLADAQRRLDERAVEQHDPLVIDADSDVTPS